MRAILIQISTSSVVDSFTVHGQLTGGWSCQGYKRCSTDVLKKKKSNVHKMLIHSLRDKLYVIQMLSLWFLVCTRLQIHGLLLYATFIFSVAVLCFIRLQLWVRFSTTEYCSRKMTCGWRWGLVKFTAMCLWLRRERREYQPYPSSFVTCCFKSNSKDTSGNCPEPNEVLKLRRLLLFFLDSTDRYNYTQMV